MLALYSDLYYIHTCTCTHIYSICIHMYVCVYAFAAADSYLHKYQSVAIALHGWAFTF